jgi:hypothetical protein
MRTLKMRVMMKILRRMMVRMRMRMRKRKKRLLLKSKSNKTLNLEINPLRNVMVVNLNSTITREDSKVASPGKTSPKVEESLGKTSPKVEASPGKRRVATTLARVAKREASLSTRNIE